MCRYLMAHRQNAIKNQLLKNVLCCKDNDMTAAQKKSADTKARICLRVVFDSIDGANIVCRQKLHHFPCI